MKNRFCGSRYAQEAKVDYVESKLDETIRNFKEAIEKSEARLEADRRATEARLEADRKAAREQLEAERIAAENRLANDRMEFEKRFAEERKEWRSTKRALYLNFGGVAALIITVVLALMNGTIPN